MPPSSLEVILRPETAAQHGAVLQLAAAWPTLGNQLKADSLHATTTPVNTATTPEMAAGTAAPTLQQVRTRLTEASRAGKAAEVKALLKQYGASSLAELAPENYAAVLAAGSAL